MGSTPSPEAGAINSDYKMQEGKLVYGVLIVSHAHNLSISVSSPGAAVPVHRHVPRPSSSPSLSSFILSFILPT